MGGSLTEYEMRSKRSINKDSKPQSLFFYDQTLYYE